MQGVPGHDITTYGAARHNVIWAVQSGKQIMPLAIVVALGSAGDVHPNVGLALSVRRRGWNVLLIAPQVFQSLAQRVGLEFIGIGSEAEYMEALRDPDLWHPFRSYRFVANRLLLPAMRPVYEIIEAHAVPGQTVITAPALAFGARIAQEKLGIPLATIHLQPLLFRSAIAPACFGFPDVLAHLPRFMRPLYFHAADQFIVDPPIVGAVNEFRAELGLCPVRRLFDRWANSPDRVIGLFPDWFAPPQADWPANVSLTGFPLWDEGDVRPVSPELEEFLEQGDPPLVFTAGSAMLHAQSFFQTAVEVCTAMGKRGILLSQFAEQVPECLPGPVRHFTYVPFSTVFPRSAALIHHGGIGTTAQAMAAGLPQLVVPYAHDQPDNAMRVRRLGIGDFVLPGRFTKTRVMEKLAAVLNPAVKQTCERLAKRVDRDALDHASAIVESLPVNAETTVSC